VSVCVCVCVPPAPAAADEESFELKGGGVRLSERALLVELGARSASPDAGRCARGRARGTSDGMIGEVLLFHYALL